MEDGSLSEGKKRDTDSQKSCLELVAIVCNINHGRSPEIMPRCRTLADDLALIGKIRVFTSPDG